MSNIKELIRQEIERRKKENMYEDELPMTIGRYHEDEELLSFLDTLPDEPEQPTIGYDEAYLNEKIAKASKSWEGVDVDKFMDEIRGREPVTTWNRLEPVTDCHDLEEAKEEYLRKARRTPGHEWMTRDIEDAFKSGAEWMKAKMMEEAYEEEVQEVYRDDDGIHCCVSVGTDYKPGEIVYVITIPKEDTGNESALHQIRG